MIKTKQEYRDLRLRRKTSKQLGDETRKDEARRAAQSQADRIQRQYMTPQPNGTELRIPSYDLSVDRSSNASSSEYSSERAVRRGLHRGSRELNEAGSAASVSEFDITTVTESIDDLTRSHNRKRKKKRSKKKPKSKKSSWKSADEEDTDGDAWMCGVCGKAFSNIEAANRHEDECIREVVTGLGWAGQGNIYNLGFVTTPANARDIVPKRADDGDVMAGMNSRVGMSDMDRSSRAFLGRSEQGYAFLSARQDTSQLNIDALLEGEELPDEEDDHELSERPRSSEVVPVESISQHFDEEVPVGALVPKRRASSEVRFEQLQPAIASLYPLVSIEEEKEDALLLSNSMRNYVVKTDEALVDVCKKAEPMILTAAEMDAERELKLLTKDKAYYDEIAERSLERQKNPSNRFRTDGEHLLGKVQNKFLDAYQIMKEGNDQSGMNDQYNRKKGPEMEHVIDHNDQTLYVNVGVRNSVQVVKNELERLAQQRWENLAEVEDIEKFTRFDRFRFYTHANLVKLAGIALASDFTPRRIAVQLSNDLYRFMTPRLKRRGVTIETEIEYRVGPYFVLAVNINQIDWSRLIKTTHRDVCIRRARWQQENKHDDSDEKEEMEKTGFFRRWLDYFKRLFSMTQYDILAQVLAWFYHLHWTIYLPICLVCYNTVLGPTIRGFIISSVTDEIFYYVEKRGMEMQIEVCRAATQAAFMLSALREIRADGRELKKKRQETEEEGKGTIVGPLLGPAIKADKGPAPSAPPDFVMPEDLEFLALELDLPAGFRRLRWAILSGQSDFMRDGVFREGKYENITIGSWSKHDELIGKPSLPDSVKEEDLIGAEREASYLMPKSAFVKANMAYETQYIEAYNDYCFCVKKKATTPDVPYGSTFIAWTQYRVVNTGNDTCKMYCSVEAEFPNGPPLVSSQIKSGMRAGVAELFVLFGEVITKYADEYP